MIPGISFAQTWPVVHESRFSKLLAIYAYIKLCPPGVGPK